MTDVIEIAANDQSIAALIDALRGDGERADRLVRLRRSQKKARAGLQQYAERLDHLYGEVERSGHDADWLEEAAKVARRRKELELEKLRPGIEALKEKLAVARRPDDGDVRRIIEDSIAICEAWLASPAALHEKLLRLAADRRAAAGEILRARPVDGEIDHRELTREHIARFPKIRLPLPNEPHWLPVEVSRRE